MRTWYHRKDGLIITSVKVIENKNIAPGAFLMTLEKPFDFLPGQVIALAIEEEDKARLYSIASGKDEEFIKVLYTVVKEGYFTPKLSTFKPGDEINVSEPFGSFTGTDEPAYWIATGTGIAPYISMLESGYSDNKILIHGSRSMGSCYFQDMLIPKLKKNYIRCCSRESSEDIFAGRVTDYLKTIEHFPADYKYYLCGNAEMIIEVRDMLIEKGVSYDRILAEVYF